MDKEVAEALKMESKALSAHKTACTLPFKQLTKLCQREGWSLDWLIMGTEDNNGNINVSDPEINKIIKHIKQNHGDKKVVLKYVEAKEKIDNTLDTVKDGFNSALDGPELLKT